MMPITDREALQVHAEEFVRGVAGLNGLRLSFEVASLAELDGLLAEWIDMASVYDSPQAMSSESLAAPIASYVGEVLVRTLGAEWIVPPPESALFPEIRLRSGHRLDVHEAVLTVLRQAAPPAFRQLARLSAAGPQARVTEADDAADAPTSLPEHNL